MAGEMRPLAVFTGVSPGAIISATMAVSHGITPSVALVEMNPQGASVPRRGSLIFSYGAESVTFADCLVASATSRTTSRGVIWSLQILDRRWRWAHGEVYGEYNRRDSEGNVIRSSERTPQQLATLLLRAMGETAFRVDSLPNETRPHVVWVGENPARELESLADSLGCRVVLRLDGSVSLERAGIGALLPNLPSLKERSLDVDPPERPSVIRVVGGATRIEHTFRLRAVGREEDGTLKLINDLSYKPKNGWERDIPPTFPNTGDSIAENMLAREFVFRWYQIDVGPAPSGSGSLGATAGAGASSGAVAAPVPLTDGMPPVTRLDQIVPISDQLVRTADDSDGAKRRLRARVHGVYWLGILNYNQRAENSDRFEQVPIGFDLIPELGVVVFNRPVYKFNSWHTHEEGDRGHFEAELYLTCSFNLRDTDSGALNRYFYALQAGGDGGVEVVRREELVLEYYSTESRGNPGGFAWSDNREAAQLDGQGAYFASAALEKYQVGAAGEALYDGIVPIELDGAIQQVMFQVGGGEISTTRASRNRESLASRVPEYEGRRLLNKLKELADAHSDRLKAKLGITSLSR